MGEKIRHSGVVVAIDGSCVHVRIVQHSACSACKVSAHCNASESKEKVVDVHSSRAAELRVGDSVTVCADSSVGFRASLYGYVVPLVLMVATLVAVLQISGSEGAAAIASVGVLVPYYMVLYLLRRRIGSQLTFEIEQ